MKAILLIGGVFGAMLLQGCAGPIPFKTLHSATYRGKVLDAQTKEPVPSAKIELTNDLKLRDRSKANERGEFEVGPLYCWSWIGKGWPYYEGRFCRHDDHNTDFWWKLTVSQKGYEKVERILPLPFNDEGGLESVEDILLLRVSE